MLRGCGYDVVSDQQLQTNNQHIDRLSIEESEEGRRSEKMLQDMIQTTSDRLINKEEVYSDHPMSAEQILEFCDEAELLTETLRTSETSSCSGCYGTAGGTGNSNECNDDNNDKGSSDNNNNLCCFDDGSFSSSDPFASMDASALSALLDEHPLDTPAISSMEYSSPSQQPTPPLPSYTSQPYNPQAELEHIIVSDVILNGYTSGSGQPAMLPSPISFANPQAQHTPAQLPIPGFEDESLVTSLSGFLGIDPPVPPPPSCSLMNQAGGGIGMFFPAGLGMPVAGEEMYPDGLMVDRMVQLPEMDYQAENGSGLGGLYGMGSNHTQVVYSPGDLQALGDGHQHGCGSPTGIVSEIPALDDSTFKVGRISPEEKHQKIQRYLKKRSERNFSKKIKYACRKTLADSRPRVRGRFAKNDELGETRRNNSTKHDDDEEEVMIKEEAFIESNDIMAELNSFKCNYTMDRWV